MNGKRYAKGTSTKELRIEEVKPNTIYLLTTATFISNEKI